jgi:hypothetical protein
MCCTDGLRFPTVVLEHEEINLMEPRHRLDRGAKPRKCRVRA